MHIKHINWITLHAKDLYPYFIPGQLDALQDFITQQGYDDPIPDVILEAIAYVRSIVFAKHPSSSVQYPFRVPSQLKSHTCHIAIDFLSTRLHGLNLSEDQLRNIKESRQYLKDIAQNTAKLMPDAPPPLAVLPNISHEARAKKYTHKTLRSF
jgi:hypothetical protein